MILYVDKEKRIMAVNSTERTDLTAVEVDETAEMFPFTGWSDTRICCYRIDYHYEQTVTEEQMDEEGNAIEVTVYSEYATIDMMTPYVPTHMMSALENLESKNTELEAQNAELSLTLDSLLTEIIPSLMV